MIEHERFLLPTIWPYPAADPGAEPVDDHRQTPLDRDEDARYLEEDDPRRIAAERRLPRR